MPGGFTPNGSVKWFVQTRTTEGEPVLKRLSNGQWRVVGKDTTPKNGFFKLVIKYPTEKFRRDFQRQLIKAASDDVAATLTLYMPIEDKVSGYRPPADSAKNYNPGSVVDWSIYVDWPVKVPKAPGGRRRRPTSK